MWRASMFSRAAKAPWIVAAALLWQAFGLAFAYGLKQTVFARQDLLLTLTLAATFVSGLMLAQAIQRATELLDGHADLGWLLSTPVAPHRILALRLASLASAVTMNWLILLGPVAVGLAVLGQAQGLWVIPLLLCLGSLAAAAGASLTFMLVPAVGLQRTRNLANAAATLIGAAVFLCAQWRTLLTHGQADALWRALTPRPDSIPGGPVWMPARILLGEAWLILPVTAAASASIAVVSLLLRRQFAQGATEALTAPAAASATQVRDRAFTASLAACLYRKEIVLLRRTPGLPGLALYYTIYLIPAAAALWRGGGALHARPFAAAPVLAAGELARLFMSACMQSEAATELVATAPVAQAAVRWAKLKAASTGAAAVMALPVLGLIVLLPGAIPAMAFGLAGVVICNLTLGLWRPMAIRRSDLRRDRKGWGGLVNLAGLGLSACWSTATWLALKQNPWALFPAGLALAALALLRPRTRQASAP